MAIAICIKCGHHKSGPFGTCANCGFSPPRHDYEANAKSLLLSTRYYDPIRDWRPSRADLDEYSQLIMSGTPIHWNDEVLKSLIEEQRCLNEHGSPSWLKIVVFVLLALLIPITAVLLSLTWIME